MSGFHSRKPFVPKKSMHPRNIYNQKTDFGQLAIDYPEFRKIAKQDVNGKITLDFQDEEALRVLNKTLLKKDFNLDVNIPPGYLVPTISLRLNYILWLEDILNIIPKSDEINGIDIGTGASCVYMLLGAKKNNWHMIGSEIDADSVKFAEENIEKNELDHLLKAILTKNEDPLFKFLNDDTKEYHFCMCNPPFHSSGDDLSNKRRSKDCPDPKNVATGKNTELSTDGGEIEFITRIIKESLEWKSRIKVYTTMIGHKKNIPVLINLLKEEGIKKIVTTEFFQGHTSRWGLAWTFLEDINLEEIGTGVFCPEKSKKKNKSDKNVQKPIIYQFSNPNKYPIKELLRQHLKDLFAELKFTIIEKHELDHDSFDITAFENTWTHQRQKRREMKRKEAADNDKVEEESTASNSNKRPAESDTDIPDSKKPKKEMEPILKFQMAVELIELHQYQLTLMYLGGSANKDAMNQVLTFLKNRLSQ